VQGSVQEAPARALTLGGAVVSLICRGAQRAHGILA
jgi:hypothetical protein